MLVRLLRALVNALAAGLDESTAPADPHSFAYGNTAPKGLDDFLVLDAVRPTGGTAIAVTDGALLAAQRQLARNEETKVRPGGCGLRRRRRAAEASG